MYVSCIFYDEVGNPNREVPAIGTARIANGLTESVCYRLRSTWTYSPGQQSCVGDPFLFVSPLSEVRLQRPLVLR